MDRQYAPLQVRAVKPGMLLCKPEEGFLHRVALKEPALEVFTDFMIVPPAVVESDCSADRANELMTLRGVRLLFIVTPAGEIAGLVTTTDLLGEKPTRIVRERGIRHSEVLVTDIMTPAAQFEAIDYEEMLHAKVGQIVQTLKRFGRQHLMVVEYNPRGRQTIRGLFSLSRIAGQLGLQLQATEIAHTFAEIEAALVK